MYSGIPARSESLALLKFAPNFISPISSNSSNALLNSLLSTLLSKPCFFPKTVVSPSLTSRLLFMTAAKSPPLVIEPSLLVYFSPCGSIKTPLPTLSLPPLLLLKISVVGFSGCLPSPPLKLGLKKSVLIICLFDSLPLKSAAAEPNS